MFAPGSTPCTGPLRVVLTVLGAALALALSTPGTAAASSHVYHDSVAS